MPNIITVNGYRFFFYSNDHPPVHIHVEKGGKTAKFNLEPTALVKAQRFNASELRKARILVDENTELFKQKWNEYFNKA